MRRAPGIVLILSGAIALALGWHLRERDATTAPPASPSETAGPLVIGPDDARARLATAAPEPPDPGDSTERAVTVEQLAQELFDRSVVKTIQDFRDDLQAFIRDAELLPAQDHEPEARELLAEVDRLAAAGYVSGPEALALQLSLLEYALPPDDFRAAAEALVSDARRRAENAEREWAERSDPQLETYRAEARRIVEQSATMDEFPDGMTRQDYLREKLRALRIETFTD